MPEPGQPIAERRRALLAGLLFSVCMTLAFPPIGLWGFALIAISPLVWCAATTRKPWRAAVFAGIGSAPFWAFEHRWLIDVTLAGWPAIVVYLSLYPALFVWIVGRVGVWGQAWPITKRRELMLIAAPIVWIGLEVLRARVAFYGYPWFRTVHPMTVYGQASWIIGVSGVGLVLCLFSTLVGLACSHEHRQLIRQQQRLNRHKPVIQQIRSLHWSAIVLFLFFLFSQVSSSIGLTGGRRGGSVAVGVIQTNVPQSNKIAWSYEQKIRDFDRFVQLSRQSVADGQDWPIAVLVWPETMFPGLALNPDAVEIERTARLRYPDGTPTTYFYDEIIALQRDIGIPMLVGAISADGLRISFDPDTGAVSIDQDALYNSVFLIEDGVVSEQRYDKVNLTPFGEVMPYISASDWLEEQLLAIGAQGMTFALSPGDRGEPIVVPGVINDWRRNENRDARVATPVCFEGTLIHAVRPMVFEGAGRHRADLVVQLSNDGWFGDWTGGREQHLQLMRWTAMVTRTPVVRAVNSGISACIGPDGSVTRRTVSLTGVPSYGEPWTEGVVKFYADLSGRQSPPVYLGNFIDWTTLAFTALVLILPMVHPGARRDRSANGADAPVINTDDADDHEGPPNADASDHEPRATTAEPDPDRSA